MVRKTWCQEHCWSCTKCARIKNRVGETIICMEPSAYNCFTWNIMSQRCCSFQEYQEYSKPSLNLLSEFRSIGDSHFNVTGIAKHCIKLPKSNTVPILLASYRTVSKLEVQKRQSIQVECVKQHQNGTERPTSTTIFSSQQDGTLWLCVRYG